MEGEGDIVPGVPRGEEQGEERLEEPEIVRGLCLDCEETLLRLLGDLA